MNIKLGLKLGLVMTATSGAFGCAATSRGAQSEASDFQSAEPSRLHVVATRSVDSRVQPMVPVHLAAEGGNIAVTFGQRGRQQVVTKLDSASLELVSSTAAGRSEAPAAPATGEARVELEDGSFVVCWTQESADGGRQVLAELTTAKGSRLGAPVLISPPDADVLGAPSAATPDGRHVIVTFAATSGESFELRAVSLEDAVGSLDAERTAQK
jgi:hypothetical protein